MKTIEERAEKWVPNFGEKNRAALKAMLTELAADLNAEKEKEVAELRAALEVEIAERDRLREQLKFSADDNLLDEVKRVLGDLTNRLEHSLTGDLGGAVEQELAEVKEMIEQLLTRLGGTANE